MKWLAAKHTDLCLEECLQRADKRSSEGRKLGAMRSGGEEEEERGRGGGGGER